MSKIAPRGERGDPPDMRKVVFGSSSTFTRVLRVPRYKRDSGRKIITTLPKVYCDGLGKLLKLVNLKQFYLKLDLSVAELRPRFYTH